jgi:hypothetical protein
MTTSMMLPAPAMLNTVMRAAVRMSLMSVAVMLTATTVAAKAAAAPIPLEAVPQPQHTEPGLHMGDPFAPVGIASITALPSGAVCLPAGDVALAR